MSVVLNTCVHKFNKVILFLIIIVEIYDYYLSSHPIDSKSNNVL